MDTADFLERVAQHQREGYRLVMINASSVPPKTPDDAGAVELAWTFEKGGALDHLRERFLPGAQVPSISNSYPYAFLYENEITELFGVEVVGRNVDFKGQLYQTATRVPMSPKAIRARLDAAKGKKP
jgi:ech hydrogenase subunit D